ncbi:MAG: fibronectin type III-like domain-contianing protein [Lachnospiraceae bacterium]
MDGSEIVQMYVALPESKVSRPEKELKGFVKLHLKAGEEKEVRIPFDDKTFRFFNERSGSWEQEEGTYQIPCRKQQPGYPADRRDFSAGATGERKWSTDDGRDTGESW